MDVDRRNCAALLCGSPASHRHVPPDALRLSRGITTVTSFHALSGRGARRGIPLLNDNHQISRNITSAGLDPGTHSGDGLDVEPGQAATDRGCMSMKPDGG